MGSEKGNVDVDESRIAGMLHTGEGKHAFRNKGKRKRANSMGVLPL